MFDENMYFKKQLDAGARLGAALTDHFIMTVVIIIFGIPVIINEFITNTFVEQKGAFWYLLIAGFALYFCKDCVQGQSIAKRLLKQQVVNNRTGQVANTMRCFVRDIFIIIWPVEVVMLLISPARRLGDRIAGTKVIPFDQNLEKPTLNYLQIGMAYILSFVFLQVLFTVIIPL